MKFKVGDHVKLTNQFGIWDGVPAYPDGYELLIDEHEGGIYGAIPENAVEQGLHLTGGILPPEKPLSTPKQLPRSQKLSKPAIRR